MSSVLATFCRDNDLPWNQKTADRFDEYLDLLLQFNDSMNLIGPLSRSEIVGELLIDSLVPAAVRTPEGPILDVGTGAGLPGIPLTIAYPDLPITLVEPRRKRSTFLKIATNRLDLADVAIERARIEEVAVEPFDYVISKAFRPPADWLEAAAPFRRDDGVVVCMTTPEEREAADAKAAELGWDRVDTLDDVGQLAGESENGDRAVYVYGV